jgi:1,4-alpha-glucan branching enzyme
MYAYSENFVLPLSHDEVVHLKGSLLFKMPGDEWQKFANLRLLLGFQAATPGKKLLFMGGEIGQWAEWDHDSSVQWQLLGQPLHDGVQRWVAHLNRLHSRTRALRELDFDPAGFEWVDFRDSSQSILAFLRQSGGDEAGGDKHKRELVLCVFNFTPVPRHGYRLGVSRAGTWREIANGDALEYGGSGIGNGGAVIAEDVPHQGRSHSLVLDLPPLAALFLEAPPAPEGEPEPDAEIDGEAEGDVPEDSQGESS